MVETNFKQTEIGLIPEDWGNSTFTGVANLKHGFQFLENHFSKSGIGVVKIGNLVDSSGINMSNLTFIQSERFNEFKNFKLSFGDVLMALTGATLGKVCRVNTHEVLLQNYRVGNFIPKENLNKGFLYFVAQSELVQKTVKDLVNSGAQPNLGKADFNKIIIPLPSLSEQQAIATALSDADAWIESLEKLIAKKLLIKQGAMQELLTPKEDWEVKKLGKLLLFGSGRDYKHLDNGTIPVYGTGGVMTYVKDFLYDGDSVGIGRKGTIDKPVFLSGKFWTVDTLFYTHSFKDSNPKYMYYQFLRINWKRYNEASGVPSLNKNTLEQIEIAIPSLPEQNRIGNILSDMDTEIDALENKLQKARQIKQGMMQQLLTGKIRLVKNTAAQPKEIVTAS